MTEWLMIALSVAVVALVYSSVGHGGASGYLAVLSFYSFSPAAMASSALTLNVVVSGLAWFSFARANHFSFRLVMPFLVLSLPMAFWGGALKMTPGVYEFLLGGALLLAAVRLMMPDPVSAAGPEKRVPLAAAIPLGGVIGLISGIVGVGGGIFLSPILLLAGWAGPKRTAAASAFFIGVNSLAGLVGRGVSGQLDPSLVMPFVLPAFVGGVVGSRLGANRFSPAALRRLLGAVLLMAAFKEIGKGFVQS